ncbi:MAG: TRAP transporter small permease subunit [Aquisalimonadaceae bacterium]
MKITIPPALMSAWAIKLHLQRAIVALCGLLLTLIIFTLVVGRYVFNTSFLGIEEAAIFIAMWFYFIGGAIGAQQRGHISASVVDMFVRNETAQCAVSVATGVISVVVAAWMTVWAWEFAAWSLQMGMRSMELGVSMGWIHMSVPVGLGLMTFYLSVELVENVATLARRLRG